MLQYKDSTKGDILVLLVQHSQSTVMHNRASLSKQRVGPMRRGGMEVVQSLSLPAKVRECLFDSREGPALMGGVSGWDDACTVLNRRVVLYVHVHNTGKCDSNV